MNENTLTLSLRIAADITMSQSLKDDLLARLSQPLSEKEIQVLSGALDSYQSETKPIIDRALNRLSDTQLTEIENISTRLLTDINADTELYIGNTERKGTENILSTI